MKTTYVRKEAARNLGRVIVRSGKTETARRRSASEKAAADRQIAEIERTFTLRYEW